MNRIAVTIGDPQGIGPEVVYKCLKEYTTSFPTIVIGSNQFYNDPTAEIIHDIEDAKEKKKYFFHLDPNSTETDISFDYVNTGINWALTHKIEALVTAPIAKEKWLQAGIPDKGHTDLLARTAGAEHYAMMFWSNNLKLVLFTIHLPLRDIFEKIKTNPIVTFTRFVHSQLKKLFSQSFTFLVAGLNPHAGESGYLGREEIDEIIPAIDILKKEMDICGPIPPDVIFLKAKELPNAVVIAWYHDQGLIPFKLLNIQQGVNVTLGLPYIRTSPDHGTAFDIAGQNIADPSSMVEALGLAETLVINKINNNSR